MNEASAIARTHVPHTRESLGQALRQLGLIPGRTVLAHASLSALGWVCGGPVAVIQALIDALSPEGTLVMPAHSADYSEPSQWQNPPVPEGWWSTIREHMPAYDPRATPTRGMGRIAELFRTWPGALRSDHPAMSFAAWGKRAKLITSGHALDHALGETSPLARLYDLQAWVLLLGVGYENNTSFHLAEYRAPGAARVEQGAPVRRGRGRVWQVYQDIDLDSEPFPAIGAALERAHPVTIGSVGAALARFFQQAPAVDFAVDWLAQQRGSEGR